MLLNVGKPPIGECAQRSLMRTPAAAQRTTPGLDIDRCVACRIIGSSQPSVHQCPNGWGSTAQTLFLLWIFQLLVACGPPPVTEGGASSDSGTQGLTCSDGVQNGNESDEDCGGDCASCADGLSCFRDRDCIHEHCDQGTCRAVACSPGERVCDGGVSRLCNERGIGYVRDFDEDCDARGFPCEDGQCVVPECRNLNCLQNRSATLVCDLYRDRAQEHAQPLVPGASSCDPGS